MSAVIVDYGLGNLFSIAQACRVNGLPVEISDSPRCIASASAVILPGIGAFGDAMAVLAARDLIWPLKDFAASGRPLLGVCLGMQLLMEESAEFGRHEGLGLISGSVDRLPPDKGLKVPNVGWSRVWKAAHAWTDTPLEDVSDGEYFYFIHSFYVRPRDAQSVLAVSRFGDVEFCSAVRKNAIVGVQFHPERSGRAGLALYRQFASMTQAMSGAALGI